MHKWIYYGGILDTYIPLNFISPEHVQQHLRCDPSLQLMYVLWTMMWRSTSVSLDSISNTSIHIKVLPVRSCTRTGDWPSISKVQMQHPKCWTRFPPPTTLLQYLMLNTWLLAIQKHKKVSFLSCAPRFLLLSHLRYIWPLMEAINSGAFPMCFALFWILLPWLDFACRCVFCP